MKSFNHAIIDSEFKFAFQEINHCARKLVSELTTIGIKALNIPAGFPFEMTRWPERVWLTGDKLFAVEAGLGHIGLNRLVVRPRHGSSIALTSVLLGNSCNQYDQPIDFNPCINCGLCVSVCPTGAVKKSDHFDFTACYTHNYREKLGGFLNWIEQIADSRSASDYRSKVSDSETVSMWQHLAVNSQTKCDRCMAVCPAGEMEIGPFLNDRKEYIESNVKRFRDKEETIYVVKETDAERYVEKIFPAKTVKHVSNGLRPDTALGFLRSLPMVFQRNRAEELDATYHFIFIGEEQLEGTVVIKEGEIWVENGLKGEADLKVTADSRAWIDFLKKDLHLMKALLLRKLRLKGNIKLMRAFADCFPS